MFPHLHASMTFIGFDLWFLIGLCFPTHLCLDWQLFDMIHSHFPSFRHQFLIYGTFDFASEMTSLKRRISSL